MVKLKKWLTSILSVISITFGGDIVIQKNECDTELDNFKEFIKHDKLKVKDLLSEIDKEDCRYFDNIKIKKQEAYESVVVIDDDNIISGFSLNEDGEPVADNITSLWKARIKYKELGVQNDKEMKDKLKKDKVKTFNIIFKKYNE